MPLSSIFTSTLMRAQLFTPELLHHFYSEKALSPETAIPMTDVDWFLLGYARNPFKSSWWHYSVSNAVKETPDGRYYLMKLRQRKS